MKACWRDKADRPKFADVLTVFKEVRPCPPPNPIVGRLCSAAATAHLRLYVPKYGHRKRLSLPFLDFSPPFLDFSPPFLDFSLPFLDFSLPFLDFSPPFIAGQHRARHAGCDHGGWGWDVSPAP